MKNLHFYIQCMMVLLALGLAIQIPTHESLIIYVIMIEFLLGIYQLGMSLMLRVRLSKKTNLLQIHFFSTVGYILTLMLLGVLSPEWIEEWWGAVLYVFPWGLAILFLVTIDELERSRHYQL